MSEPAPSTRIPATPPTGPHQANEGAVSADPPPDTATTAAGSAAEERPGAAPASPAHTGRRALPPTPATRTRAGRHANSRETAAITSLGGSPAGSAAAAAAAAGWSPADRASRPGEGEFASALDAARTAFRWLVTGPRPVSLDGRGLPGMPARPVPLDELSDVLLARGCPWATRDAVWARLVERARAEGGTWTVACVGVALPALVAVAGQVAERFASDPNDLDAAVLVGFLEHLADVDLTRPGIANRLRWAAYRAGLDAVREALDAPTPRAPGSVSAPPPPPCGHPDLVLARAVTDGALTAAEAELIGSTRLGETTLAAAPRRRGVSYQTLKRARARAEQRLLTYLRHHHATEAPTEPALEPAAVSAVGRHRVSAIRGNRAGALSPKHPKFGVRGRRNPLSTATPAPGAPGLETRRCA